MLCFVLRFLWISVFTLSLVLDVSSSSGMVFIRQLHFTTHTQFQIHATFFSSGCCCPTLSCHRQLNLYPNFFHISHRENVFEVMSLQITKLTLESHKCAPSLRESQVLQLACVQVWATLRKPRSQQLSHTYPLPRLPRSATVSTHP